MTEEIKGKNKFDIVEYIVLFLPIVVYIIGMLLALFGNVLKNSPEAVKFICFFVLLLILIIILHNCPDRRTLDEYKDNKFYLWEAEKEEWGYLFGGVSLITVLTAKELGIMEMLLGASCLLQISLYRRILAEALLGKKRQDENKKIG